MFRSSVNGKIKTLMLLTLVAVLSVTLASASLPSLSLDNQTKPLKERLQAFYDDKETYINQKILCKEEVMVTQAPSGTCWNRLKPLMINLLLKQVNITRGRLIQLNDINVTFSNIDEIIAQLTEAKAIFEDASSSKFLIKSTAKNLETLINDIEDVALQNQTEKLIDQMDKIMLKADAITVKLEAKLIELRASGVDVSELEASLNDYKTELASTKVSIADAKAKYAQMGSATSEEISSLAKEIRTFLNNAQNYLVKAFDKARKMIPNMSDSDGNNSPDMNNTEGGV